MAFWRAVLLSIYFPRCAYKISKVLYCRVWCQEVCTRVPDYLCESCGPPGPSPGSGYAGQYGAKLLTDLILQQKGRGVLCWIAPIAAVTVKERGMIRFAACLHAKVFEAHHFFLIVLNLCRRIVFDSGHISQSPTLVGNKKYCHFLNRRALHPLSFGVQFDINLQISDKIAIYMLEVG